MSSWENVYPEDDCGICMNQYTIQENVTWFPCNHCVCLKCYLQCSVCPICRAPFNRNIKPPIYKQIQELTIHIIKRRMNNTEVTDLEYRLNELSTIL